MKSIGEIQSSADFMKLARPEHFSSNHLQCDTDNSRYTEFKLAQTKYFFSNILPRDTDTSRQTKFTSAFKHHIQYAQLKYTISSDLLSFY